jgi:hypothetical protein
MDIQVGNKVTFLEYGSIKNAEVNGNKLLLMINAYKMCAKSINEVTKVAIE